MIGILFLLKERKNTKSIYLIAAKSSSSSAQIVLSVGTKENVFYTILSFQFAFVLQCVKNNMKFLCGYPS